MIIKAWYICGGDYVKAVKFEADRNYQPMDKKVIYANAPENWDECKWDHGSVKPKKKKKKVEVIEEPNMEAEITNYNND